MKNFDRTFNISILYHELISNIVQHFQNLYQLLICYSLNIAHQVSNPTNVNSISTSFNILSLHNITHELQ